LHYFALLFKSDVCIRQDFEQTSTMRSHHVAVQVSKLSPITLQYREAGQLHSFIAAVTDSFACIFSLYPLPLPSPSPSLSPTPRTFRSAWFDKRRR